MSSLFKEYFYTIFIIITGLISIVMFVCVFSNDSFSKKIGFNSTNNEKVISQDIQLNTVEFSVPDIIVLENGKKPLDYVTASLKENNDLLPFVKIEETYFLDYIQSSGNEYIDTGIKAAKNINVIIEFEIDELSDSTMLFGTTEPNNEYGAYITRKDDNFYIVPKVTNSPEPEPILLTPGKHIYSQVSDGTTLFYSLDDTNLTDTQLLDELNYNITLFSDGEEKKTAYKLYSCKIYSCEELIRDFIPTKSNADVFLYDTISKAPYKNSGTGNFESGNATSDRLINFTLIFDNKNITKSALIKEEI